MSTIEKDYNTRRPQMVIPEYGRNIQKMVEHAISIENREERNRVAQSIINVMGQLNPHLRDIVDFKHKLWDHLFIISDFKLDVDSPYPYPDKEKIFEKPKPLEYPQSNIRFKHYGKSTEAFIAKAIEMEDGEEKTELIKTIANLMKKSYLTWNRESVDDDLIVSDLKLLSKGQLKLDDSFKLEQTNDILALNVKKKTNTNHKNKNHKNNKNFQKKRRF
ncbi:MAG: DUF4290 domain-containing protein [Flavobacteriales bacterium]|nr:DUF4290 domain-containing protein [Flavobacteriales bacterium]MBX2958727.1 DUF4290 domain-containing protein [Flavobacteriales bacterium]HRN40823.1 DUF4290 domain-containing protein [Vicingus sp.]